MSEPSSRSGAAQAPRRIAVVLVDRANYGRLKPVMDALADRDDVELSVVAAGTMVLDRFARAVEVVRDDGFEIASELFFEVEGSTPGTMAMSVGMGLMEFSREFHRLKPDLVLIIGDRYEALAATVAAAYMNLCVAHIQGGEVSGSIDESARHAITKFAHYHVPATRRAADFLERMGERPDTIVAVGCPSSDLARVLKPDLVATHKAVNEQGSGAIVDLDKPFLLVVFHPTTTTFGDAPEQIGALLQALDEVRRPTLLLWPNIDAGADHISKVIRQFRGGDHGPESWLRTIKNLEPETYLEVLSLAACAVGNSSSFVRDAGYFGSPVVLVGDRQLGREWDDHVTWVSPLQHDITEAVQDQLSHGRYAPSSLYGDGHVSVRVAEALATVTIYVQKRLGYIDPSSETSGMSST